MMSTQPLFKVTCVSSTCCEKREKKRKEKKQGKGFHFFFIAHKKRKKKRRADSWQNLIFFCWKTNFFFYIFTIVWQNGASKCNTRSGSKRPFLFFPYLFIQPFSHSWGCWQYQKDILFCSPPPSLPQYTFCQQTKQTRKEKIYFALYIFIHRLLPVPRNSLMFYNAEGNVIKKRIANISPLTSSSASICYFWVANTIPHTLYLTCQEWI